MDTTKKHIKMCEKAEEILKRWIPKDGDFVWHPNEGAEYMGTWEFPEKFDIVFLSDNEESWWRNWLWLPRQDQLQAIIGDDAGFRTQINLIDKMLAECVNEIGYGLTWERLWLRIVMKEKYQKTWNGKDWIKDKK